MHVIKEHIVSFVEKPTRLSDFCNGLFPGLPTRSSIKKAFKRKEIYLNDEPADSGHWIQVGDRIQWMDLEDHPPQPYHLDPTILYEDDYLIAVNKPAGIPVSGNQFRTLQNALPHNTKPSSQPDSLKWPKPVHRLDAPTTGIVLFAKTAQARSLLGEQFEFHQVQKTYHAIVVGKLEGKGEIRQSIDGKEAISRYESLQVISSLRTNFLSLIQLKPITGRTHQLRIHLNTIGHPIVGDPLYGDDVAIRHKGLFLTASEIELIHPIHHTQLIIKCPVPHKFQSLMERESRRWSNYHSDNPD